MKTEIKDSKKLVTNLTERIQKELIPVQAILNRHFLRTETRNSAFEYLQGMISLVERKNSWQLAEQVGYENPYAFQHLLGRALWDANDLRDAIREYTVSHLGPRGVLSIDETGFLKKGKKSAGVARQYSGTAGRIENCQVGVFLSYATAQGRALLDRELYIPEEWFEDKLRCLEAGIPESLQFKTKPELAKDMLKRALGNNIQPEWVVGDQVYGGHSLRTWLEEQRQAYVLAVASNYHVWLEFKQYKVSHLLKMIDKKSWQTLSAGKGTKGERNYQWQAIKINSNSPQGWGRYLVFRRNIKDKDEISFYIAFAPDNRSLTSIAEAVGTRWTIEECFEMAKGEVGLDQYEVRSWKGWYRHITFSMFALSFLVKLRIQLNKKEFHIIEKKANGGSIKAFLKSRGLS